MKPLIIYTAVFGGYENSLPKITVEKGIEYRLVCFTDTPSINNPSRFKIVYVPRYFDDNKANTVYLRANPHLLFPYKTYTIWIDGNFTEFNLTRKLLEDTLELYPVCAPFHRYRTTVKEEYHAVLDCKLENKIRAETHLLRLKNYDIESINHLTENGIIFRDIADGRVRMANESWWEMLFDGVRRSQLAFDSALKMHGLSCADAGFRFNRKNLIFKIVVPLSRGPKRVMTNKPEWIFSSLNPPVLGAHVAAREHWTEKGLDVFRGLNAIIERVGHLLHDNYCHMGCNPVQAETPADVRRSYKREFLRNSISGRGNILEIGFNGGYSANIILSNSLSSKLTSTGGSEHPYSRQCAEYIKSCFRGRFEATLGDTVDILQSRQLCDKAPWFDFVHINGYQDAVVFLNCIEWYLARTNPECILLIDETYKPQVMATLKTFRKSKAIKEIRPKMISNGECGLYQKVTA